MSYSKTFVLFMGQAFFYLMKGKEMEFILKHFLKFLRRRERKPVLQKGVER